MIDILFDIKHNAALHILKIVLCALLGFCFYCFAAMSVNVDEAIEKYYSKQSEYNLYTLIDSLSDPEAFSEFVESERSVDLLGAFYDALNSEEDFAFLSIFNQAIPIVDFSGDERFRYTYGTPMAGDDTFVDPLDRFATNVKSVQLNRNAFDFFGLGIAEGASIPWDAVDYSNETIPVLLGSDYSSFYHVGDVLEGWLYLSDADFLVVGFLNRGSTIFYKGENDYYLDTSIIIPYPPDSRASLFGCFDLRGIALFAMVNGDIAVPREMNSQEVLNLLAQLSRETGFDAYQIAFLPSYLTQLNFMRSLVIENYSWILALIAFITITIGVIIAVMNRAMWQRRENKIVIRWEQGESLHRMFLPIAVETMINYAVVFAVLLTLVVLSPNQELGAFKQTISCLLVFCALDAIVQMIAGRTAAAKLFGE